LPLFIKLLKVEEVDDHRAEADQIEEIRLQLAKESVSHLDDHYTNEMQKHETIARIKEQLQRSIHATEMVLSEQTKKEDLASVRGLYREIMLELIALRRQGLNRLRFEKKYDDEVIRGMETNLDLEEARLNKQ